MTTATCTHDVPFHNLGKLRDALVSLNRRAKRLGVPGYTLTHGEPFLHTWKETAEGGNEVTRREERVSVSVTGAPVMLAGWQLLARVDHLPSDKGESIAVLLKAPGVERDLSEFGNTTSRCDHCNKARQRNAVYIVEHTDGRTLVVGNTCLRDFTGLGRSPESVCALAFDVSRLMGGYGDEDEGMRGGAAPWCEDTATFLAVTAGVIRKFGWLPRSKAQAENRTATADMVYAWMVNPSTRREMEKAGFVGPSRGDRALALLANRWAQRLVPNGDYELNLNAIARAGYVTTRVVGLAASIVSSYSRHRQKEQEAKQSGVDPKAKAGEEGKRAEFEVQVVGIVAMEFSSRVTMIDKATGATMLWWASGVIPNEIKPAATVKIVATVKKYGEYRGVMQTTVSRLSISTGKPVKVAKPKKAKLPVWKCRVAIDYVDGTSGHETFHVVGSKLLDDTAAEKFAEKVAPKHAMNSEYVTSVTVVNCTETSLPAKLVEYNADRLSA